MFRNVIGQDFRNNVHRKRSYKDETVDTSVQRFAVGLKNISHGRCNGTAHHQEGPGDFLIEIPNALQLRPESRLYEVQILTFIDGNVYRTGLADEHQEFDDLGESIKCGVKRKFDHLLDGLQPQFDQFARGGPRAKEVHERHFRLLP